MSVTMSRAVLFICHSSSDDDVVRSLRIHLDPLFHTSAVSVWDDSMLFAGQPWDPAIRKEMEQSVAVVVLVSPMLLNSSYVREEELPKFLTLAEATQLPIYCIYLDHSVVDQVDFIVRQGGTLRKRRLTEYQGLNSPRKPLTELPRKERNRVLAEAAKRIHGDLKSKTGEASGVKRSIQGKVDREPVLGRRTLYVEVERVTPHQRYKKPVKSSKVFAVHWYEDLDVHAGDWVEIEECRPISRTKHHALVRRIRR